MKMIKKKMKLNYIKNLKNNKLPECDIDDIDVKSPFEQQIQI